MEAVLVAAALAGSITTVAGFGGGLLLVLTLAAVMDPAAALSLSAAALLLGSVHRLWLLRTSVDRRTAAVLALGIVPGTLLGAAVAASLPSSWLRLVLLATAIGALSVKLASMRIVLRPRRLLFTGAGIGVFGATGGGAGLFAGPLLLAGGLRGDRYVATMAAVSVTLNASRSVGYQVSGWLDGTLIPLAFGAAAAMMVGNLIGRAAARQLGERWRGHIETAIPFVALVLAVVGMVSGDG